MDRQFLRTAKLVGEEGIATLQQKTVAVFGLGGVGGFAVEALARSGIGKLIIVDFDHIDCTNLNRQIIALHSTIGRLKTEVFQERLLDINPNLEVIAVPITYNRQFNDSLDAFQLDFVIDAIDMVSSKLDLIAYCYEKDIPVISSMGTANKMKPELLTISTIEKTMNCGLARVMRKELKNRHIEKVPVVFSPEESVEPFQYPEDMVALRRSVPGSTSFVPPTAGMLLASYVIRKLLGQTL
jgi:tRNA A37 threonylcarbamoyladenosine dehydratase